MPKWSQGTELQMQGVGDSAPRRQQNLETLIKADSCAWLLGLAAVVCARPTGVHGKHVHLHKAKITIIFRQK